jgi:hypothetical protein
MAGAFDRDIVIPAATAPTAPVYKDPIQVKTELGAIQKEYLATRSQTGTQLTGMKATLEDLGRRASEIKDPVERAWFVETQKLALNNTNLALELQAIVDANDNANAGASKQAQDLLKSDAIFTSQGTSGISNTGKYYLNGVEVSKETYVGTGGGGSRGLGGGTGGSQTPAGQSGGTGNLLANPEYAALIASLESYGLKNIASVLEQIRVDNPSISGEGMLTLLRNDARYNKEYLVRFSGNEKLKTAGKPMLDERTYLANEAAYEKVFTQYQLPQFVDRSKYADFIGGSIAPTEVASRVSLAYDRLLKANPGSLDAFRRFFPQLSTGDIVGAMLDPAEQLPALQRKVIAAEVGGAAIEQGLNASLAAQSIQSQKYANLQSGTVGAETLQQAGIEKDVAQAGYEKIATELPTMEKLSSIYGTTLEAYTQKEAEQSQLLGLASATRKKQQLLAREAAQFQGTAGTTKGSFSTQYLSRQSSTGAF